MKRYFLGEFEEIVLLLVAIHHEDAYGLAIAKSIREKLKRKVTLSSVHTALYRMEEKGFVTSIVGGATQERGGRRKRIFNITALGKKALENSKASRDTLWQMIPKMRFDRV